MDEVVSELIETRLWSGRWSQVRASTSWPIGKTNTHCSALIMVSARNDKVANFQYSENNTDIYWAMSGGGGGTYGIALSLTSKAHKDTPVAGMNMTFARANGSLDDYYSAIQVYQDSLAEMTDHGIMAVTFFDNSSFAITPITAPNMTVKELKGYLSPFEEKLDELEIDYTSYYQQSETYKEHFNSMMPDLEVSALETRSSRLRYLTRRTRLVCTSTAGV